MTTFTPAHRQRLQDVRDRKRKALERVNATKAAIDIANQHSDPTAAGHAEVALELARGDHSLAVELESALLHQLAGVSDPGGGETCFDDPTVIRTLEQLAHSKMPVGNMMLGPVHDRDQVTAMIESGSWKGRSFAAAPDVDVGDGARIGPYRGVIAQLRMALTVLDLIPTAAMESGSFYYSPETGDLDTGAAETAEGAIKPASTVTLDDAECRAVTIAHFQVAAPEPGN